MDCLLCGKEIGAIRLTVDDEFCCAGHRKQYREHLGTLLSAPLPLQRTPAPNLPMRGFIPLEFFCRQTSSAPSKQLTWSARTGQPILPPLSLDPSFETLMTVAPVKRRTPVRHASEAKVWRHTIQSLAACLAVCVSVWIVGAALQSAARNTHPGSTSTLARVRRAISERAAATVSDTFREGYTHTGPLELFKPDPIYRDYHLAFCGEIESKSIDWAVRARDQRNYYAMKFTVIEPGLRPVIALVHYPVVDGRKGQPVEIPLTVMVHNRQPMVVDVDVKGNKLLTSVDGQLVDTWIDDALAAGGVGFFSDTGERARLYWVSVSRNEDLVGRICSYLSLAFGGDTATQLARIYRWNF